MEKILKALFDYQRFENNNRLTAIIEETVAGYCVPLSDDDLEFVTAAGEAAASPKPGTATGDYPHV